MSTYSQTDHESRAASDPSRDPIEIGGPTFRQIEEDELLPGEALVLGAARFGTHVNLQELTVRGAFLRQLLTGVGPGSNWVCIAVDIENAAIDGDLVLDGLSTRGPLVVTRSAFSGVVSLESAKTHRLLFSDCRFHRGIYAPELRTSGSVRILGSRFDSWGGLPTIGLVNAEIDGDLVVASGCECDALMNLNHVSVRGNILFDGRFVAGEASDESLSLSGNVGGDVIFSPVTHIEGTINISGLSLGGRLSLAGTVHGVHDAAVLMNGLQAGSDLDFHPILVITGRVEAQGVSVGGQWDIGGDLHADAGPAIHGDSAKVIRSINLRPGLSARGGIRIPGAQVGGQLVLNGDISGNSSDDPVLMLTQAHISAGLFCNDDLKVSGTVLANSMTVDSDLVLRGTFAGATEPGISILGTSVDGCVKLEPDLSVEASVDLREIHTTRGVRLLGHVGGDVELSHADIGSELLVGRSASVVGTVVLIGAKARRFENEFPDSCRNVAAEGLHYSEVADHSVGDWADWIRDRTSNDPRIYSMLARAFADSGHTADAARLLAQGERVKQRPKGPLGRAWGLILRLTVNYGYQPARALVWVVVLLTVASLTAWGFADQFVRTGGNRAGSAIEFEPILYSLARVFPLGNSPQTEYFTETGAAQWLFALYTAVGAILAIASLAGITGALVRRPQ